MKIQPALVIACLVAVFTCQEAMAMDQALVGTWTTSATSPKGRVDFKWTIQSNGRFEVSVSGSEGSKTNSGAFLADSGSWTKVTQSGQDKGQYIVLSPTAFRLIGRNNMQQDWTRVGAPPASLLPASGPAPLSASAANAQVKSVLLDNFPLLPAADDADRYCLPGLAKAVGKGMRKRQFRSVM